jgi:DNA-binding transcriptional ArsR family regulator
MTETHRLDALFHALADPTRREILGLVAEGERSTGRIAESFPQSRPAISKHLRVLSEARLIVQRKAGRNRLYRLRAERLEEAHAWLTRWAPFWRESLSALKRHVEEEGR